MPLNDLIKDYSINTISEKTNISIEVLEKLLNKEWDSLQRAKVDGFFRIIEREFDLDLSDIREEAKDYYNAHKSTEPNRPIDLVDAQTTGGRGGFVTAILSIIIAALVLYAIWYYFFSNNHKQVTIEGNASSGLFKDSLDSAKKLIGETNSSTNTTKVVSSNTTNSSTNEEKQSTNTTTQVANNSSSPSTEGSKKFDITEINKSTEESQNTSSSNENNNDSTINEVEKNRSIKEAVNALLEENKTDNSAEINSTNVENLESNSALTLSSEANTTVAENNISSLETNKTTDSNSEATSSTNSIEDNLNSAKAINKITFKNKAKTLWIGVYDINKNKRIVKVMSKTPYDLVTNGDKIAIVTGHNKFSIASDTGIDKSFSKRGRVYLLVTKNEIKYISKREYKRVTKHKAW